MGLCVWFDVPEDKKYKILFSVGNRKESITYTKKFLARDGTLKEFSVVVSTRATDAGGIGIGNVLTAIPGTEILK